MLKTASRLLKTVTPKKTPDAHAKARRKGAVQLKFPRAGETVNRPSYSVQIEATPEPVRVELRINDADWHPCREALGLFWYDWSGFEPGAHRLVARITTQDGGILESVEREILAV
jgi:hypothetical protein